MATANDVVTSAKSYLGYTEGKNNNTIFGADLGKNFLAWCASFVSDIADKAGLHKNVDYPYTASSGEGVNWFKKKGLFHTATGYTPQSGDFIYFWDGSKVSHVGLVDSVSNGVITTVEGNTGSGVVGANHYKLSDAGIYGYGSPVYDDSSSGPTISAGANSTVGRTNTGTTTTATTNISKQADSSTHPSVWGWITGENTFLDGVTGLSGDQRKARVTLTLLFLGGIVLVFLAIGFMFGQDILTIAAPEAGLAMNAASAAKSE